MSLEGAMAVGASASLLFVAGSVVSALALRAAGRGSAEPGAVCRLLRWLAWPLRLLTGLFRWSLALSPLIAVLLLGRLSFAWAAARWPGRVRLPHSFTEMQTHGWEPWGNMLLAAFWTGVFAGMVLVLAGIAHAADPPELGGGGSRAARFLRDLPLRARWLFPPWWVVAAVEVLCASAVGDAPRSGRDATKA